MPRNRSKNGPGHRLIDMENPSAGSPNVFSIYSKMVEDDDDKRAERHQKDADGIVLFTGLFSAALSALLAVSIQDLRPDPQDKPTFYLENIYQLLADTNVSRAPTVVKPPPFSPPRYAIWVNSLWFSSLAISLTSALLATLLQQWARRYIKVTQPLGSPEKRARIRQYFFSGDDNLHFLLAADAVPTLLHLSVLLFFAGLLILLRNTNHTVFYVVVGWVGLCVMVYGYITVLPIVRPAIPHYAPLPSFAWQFYSEIQYLFAKLRSLISHKNVVHRPARLLKRLEDKAGEIVLGKSLELDAQILKSLLDTLVEDRTREEFFEAVSDFYSSWIQKDPNDFKDRLSQDFFFTKFKHSVNQFLDQTLSSDSISESTRSRRLLTCLNATHKVLGERVGRKITDRIINSEDWNDVPPSPAIWYILRRWRKSTDLRIAVIGSCIMARIIASVRKHDDTWMALAISELSLTFKGDLKQGNSLFLANLIYATRLFFEKQLQFKGILRSISRFDAKDTLPELQRDFCTLWNKIVQRANGSRSPMKFVFILEEIRSVFNDLHPDGDDTLAIKFSKFSCSSCPDPCHLPPHAQQISSVATSSLPDRPSSPLLDNSLLLLLDNLLSPLLDNSLLPLPGSSSSPLLDNSSSPLPGNSSSPLPGNSSSPLPGNSSSPLPGNSSSPLPGNSSSPLPGNSSSPLPGNSSSPLPDNSSLPVTSETFGEVPGGSP